MSSLSINTQHPTSTQIMLKGENPFSREWWVQILEAYHNLLKPELPSFQTLTLFGDQRCLEPRTESHCIKNDNPRIIDGSLPTNIPSIFWRNCQYWEYPTGFNGKTRRMVFGGLQRSGEWVVVKLEYNVREYETATGKGREEKAASVHVRTCSVEEMLRVSNCSSQEVIEALQAAVSAWSEHRLKLAQDAQKIQSIMQTDQGILSILKYSPRFNPVN